MYYTSKDNIVDTYYYYINNKITIKDNIRMFVMYKEFFNIQKLKTITINKLNRNQIIGKS